jgi:uncharacterized protein YqjF (DUF2071 family)
MRHDKWANVLFVHWAVPPDLEPLLLDGLNGNDESSRFELDKYMYVHRSSPDGDIPRDNASANDRNSNKDGTCANRSRAYVGLVLLTEHNVGPTIGRGFERLLVTHHGANIRTYVRPTRGCNNDNADDDYWRGITFASLECDDRFTSWGANVFGMPYRVASMERIYHCAEGPSMIYDERRADVANEEQKDNDLQALVRKNALSSKEVDDLMCRQDGRSCGDGKNTVTSVVSNMMSMKSVRQSSGGLAGILGKRLSMMTKGSSGLHSSRLVDRSADTTGNMISSNAISTGSGYSVDCQWEVYPEEKLTDEEVSMANFFAERYHVYTRKYGLHWRGTVAHEEWPIQKANIKNLAFSNINEYEPCPMLPILRHMAKNKPDSVLFSRGVGPIDFAMLRPV